MMMGFGFLVLLLIGGVLLLPLLGGASRNILGLGNSRQPTARQVLDERLARGEISAEEYETLRARIEG